MTVRVFEDGVLRHLQENHGECPDLYVEGRCEEALQSKWL